MNLNDTLRARMSAATRALMAGGPGAATDAIRHALNAMPAPGGMQMPSMPDFLRDMDFPSGKNANATGAMPDFVSELLARLGVPAADDWGIGQHVRQTEPAAQPDERQEPDAKSGGRFLTKSFTTQAGTRQYKVYIPTGYTGQPMPLMVMLHGCKQHPDDFAAGTRMNAIAEEKQCFVVYPAQAQSANSSKCWNWFNAVDQQRDQGEPSIIAGITREVLDTYKLDAGKVYVAGLSAGGAMAVIMGTTYPELYAAVGVHSGLPYASAQDLPSAFAAMRGGIGTRTGNGHRANARLKAIPIIVFHGDRDKTVDVRNGNRLMEENTADTVDTVAGRIRADVIVEEGNVPGGHSYTRTSHHAGGGPAIAEHWVIHGAGHAWAGGSSSGSYTDAKGPDATREMMRFFYTQPAPRHRGNVAT